MNISAETLQNMVDYVEQTSGLISKQAEVSQQLAGKAPAVVDKLIKSGFLKENQRATAEVAAQDPLKLLESLSRLASTNEKAAGESPESLGSADASPQDKKASAELPTRGTADRKFLEAFGLV